MNRLDTTSRDAAELERILKDRYNFTVVRSTDADMATMQAQIAELRSRSKGAKYVLIYFGGYAFNSRDLNYLLAKDSRIGSDLEKSAIPLSQLTEAIDPGVEQAVVLLDASYSHPGLEALRDGRGSAGLSRIADPREGVAIISAQVPGKGVARPDGARGAMADALKSWLDTDRPQPATLGTWFDFIRSAVFAASQSDQEPWIAASQRTRGERVAALTSPASLSVFSGLLSTPAAAAVTPPTLSSIPVVQDPSEERRQVNRRLIERQSDEEITKSIQQALVDKKCLAGDVDGKWGEKSKQAMLQFASVADNHSELSSGEPSRGALLAFFDLERFFCPPPPSSSSPPVRSNRNTDQDDAKPRAKPHQDSKPAEREKPREASKPERHRDPPQQQRAEPPRQQRAEPPRQQRAERPSGGGGGGGGGRPGNFMPPM